MFVSLDKGGISLALFFIISFGISLIAVKFFEKYLPHDRGRGLAHDGEKSKGKFTSLGIVFISCFVVNMNVFFKLNLEYRIYSIAIMLEMLAGFLDDNSKKPWGELKKGLFDLAVALMVAAAFIFSRDSRVIIAVLGYELYIPRIILFALSAILVLVSINVCNITDGVDGLSSSLMIVSLLSFTLAGRLLGSFNNVAPLSMGLIAGLMVYLLFNSSPSTHLMGDAGSRAMGLCLAVIALKSNAPFLFIPFAFMIIVDGGSSLIKLSVRRYLKIKSFMQSIRTPIHDHVRKHLLWSDTKTVARFMILQLFISMVTILIIAGGIK